MELAPYMADIILDQIHKNGYTTGEVTAFDSRCGLIWIIDASKDASLNAVREFCSVRPHTDKPMTI